MRAHLVWNETTWSQTPYCGAGRGHPPEPVSAKAPWLQMRFMVIAPNVRLRGPAASVQVQRRGCTTFCVCRSGAQHG